ncbi:MAG: NADH-quinone oxidoreductase subunit F, partial [Erysipelotrichia bacterium]|nr:NADH-quinone oxidoreductase subunit F [Erysipelotrichia bacterium]
MYRMNILCCAGTGCTASNSTKIYDNFNECLKKYGLEDEVKVIKTGCFGLCQKGPIVAVYPDKVFYCHVTPEDVEKIVSEHIYKGRVVKELELSDEDLVTHEKILDIDKIKFYEKQQRIALRNCGKINPEDISEYIAMDGYEALGKVLSSMTPQQVIDEIKKSGLRGRGGAGFPTGVKWQFEKDQTEPEKYVICNADEGDPGAFMDRSILEGDPNAIIEGMTIMGYAVGAHLGYIYIRAEYPIAVHRLKIAIREAEELGLLGKNIFNSGFDFDVEIRLGAGAFVCGEET